MGLYKKTPYSAFAREYPTKQTVLEDIIEKAGEVFASVISFFPIRVTQLFTRFLQDKNMGLVRLALERARRWAIRRLTETYISISLAEIGNTVGLVDDVEAVRTIVQSMVRRFSLTSQSFLQVHLSSSMISRGFHDFLCRFTNMKSAHPSLLTTPSLSRALPGAPISSHRT